MTDHDVPVATPANDDEERPERSVAQQLVEQVGMSSRIGPTLLV